MRWSKFLVKEIWSPFTNISLFDKHFLESLCPDYSLNGYAAKPELVRLLQDIYIEAMNDELERTVLTFKEML